MQLLLLVFCVDFSVFVADVIVVAEELCMVCALLLALTFALATALLAFAVVFALLTAAFAWSPPLTAPITAPATAPAAPVSGPAAAIDIPMDIAVPMLLLAIVAKPLDSAHAMAALFSSFVVAVVTVFRTCRMSYSTSFWNEVKLVDVVLAASTFAVFAAIVTFTLL